MMITYYGRPLSLSLSLSLFFTVHDENGGGKILFLFK